MVGYVIVEFRKTKCAAVVPLNWVIDGYCFWPPDEIGKNLQPIIQKGLFVTCGETWDRHPVRTIGKTYDSWHMANRKLKKYLETSDVETTDVDDLGKGKRGKKRAKVSDSSSSEDETQIASPPKFYSDRQMLDQDFEREEYLLDSRDLLQNQPEPSQIEDTPPFLTSGKMPGLVEVEEDHLSLNTEELLQNNSESLLGEFSSFCRGLPSTVTKNHTALSKTSTQIEPITSPAWVAVSQENLEQVHCDASTSKKSEYLRTSNHTSKKRKFSKNVSMTSISPGQSITEQFHGPQMHLGMDAFTQRANDASTHRDSEYFLPPKSSLVPPTPENQPNTNQPPENSIKKGKLSKDKESQPLTGAILLHPNAKQASEYDVNKSIQSWLRHAKARLKVV